MKYILPRFRDIFFLTVFCGALLLGHKMLGIDSDLGRHLVIGKYILQQHEIPSSNIFSYTKSGESRPPYEWLAQTFFAFAYRFLGLDGVVLLTSLVIAGAFTLVYVEATRRSELPFTAIFLAILAAAAGSVHWLPRPHIFTFLFLAIWLERLERLRSAEKIPLWQFPLIMVLWANLHGGFVFGLLAWVATFAGWVVDNWLNRDRATTEVGKKLLLIGALSLIASCITPDGWGNWRALFGNSSVYILRQTIETMPPSIHQPGMMPFFILLILSVILLGLGGFRLPIGHIFLAAGFAILSLLMARNIPLFAISVTPILAASTRRMLNQASIWVKIESRLGEIEHTLRGFVWPAVGILAAVILFSYHYIQTGSSFNQFDERVFPVAAVNWLQDHPQSGNMFNEFNWGGYLLQRLWPEQNVFIDSQTDFYGEALARDYNQILNAQNGWETKLIKYDIDWVIVESDASVAQALETEYHWQVLYQDDTSVILRK
jgi:hypothetical protein